MTHQNQTPHWMQNLAAKIDKTQQMIDMAANLGPKPPIHMGSIDLDKLLAPDISVELTHVIALMQAAFEQIEHWQPSPCQTAVAVRLLSDALREAKGIYQNMYGDTQPPAKGA